MKRLISGCLLLAFVGAAAPVYAQAGSAIAAAQYAEQKTFDTFMHMQVVQELLVLKQNYDASVQYYNEFRQLNSGKGYFANVTAQIKTAVENDGKQFDKQVTAAFTQTNSNTMVDQFVQGVNKGIYNSLTYTTDEALNLVAQRKAGSDIATSANGLSPKDAENLSAKAGGIQIQMLTQLHADNLRLIQLLSMQLAGQSRDPSGQSQTMNAIRASLKTRAPNYQVPDEPAQGGGQ
jgi:hypothetical protein